MTTSLEEKLRGIIQHAYDHTQAVKAIFDQAGLTPDDVQALADLDKIPVTGKDRLVELQQAEPPFGGFLAVPVENLQHVFFSPGPLYEPHAGESAVMDTIKEIFGVAGFSPGDVVINTFGYHLIPTGLAIDQVLTEMGATVIPAGVGNADLQIKMMLLDEPSLGLAPLLVQEIFEEIKKMSAQEGMAIVLVEQNARVALKISDFAYVMENGRVVLDGPAAQLAENEDIKEFYLGLTQVGERKSYRDVKHYKRRKRWLG